MEEALKDKIKKIYALADKGDSGERHAAKRALDRLMKKYNLSDEDVQNAGINEYEFKYQSNLEADLFIRLVRYFINSSQEVLTYAGRTKRLLVRLNYEDYVTIDCAYEYFRRHMKTQYKTAVYDKIKRYKKNKALKELREKMDLVFLSQYLSKSGLFEESASRDPTIEEVKLFGIVGVVEGGTYKKQVDNNKFLTA